MTTPTQLDRPAPTAAAGGKPTLEGQRTPAEQLLVTVFVVVPLAALIAAVPLAWGWGLGWTDLGLALGFYVLSGQGVNAHHADPTCARHGVLPGQVDISARLIWCWEKLGWVHQVRWPTPVRLARITATRCGQDPSA